MMRQHHDMCYGMQYIKFENIMTCMCKYIDSYTTFEYYKKKYILKVILLPWIYIYIKNMFGMRE